MVEEKGTGPICRNGPKGAVHKLDLSPFPTEGGTEVVRRQVPVFVGLKPEEGLVCRLLMKGVLEQSM